MDWNNLYDVHSENECDPNEGGPLPRNILEMNSENLIFQQYDLFPSAFPLMADIRRQGKLCDVVLKVFNNRDILFISFVMIHTFSTIFCYLGGWPTF